MATWEEILEQSYNPVNTVRDRYQALRDRREAENIARMRAANPGFQAGGYGNQTPMNYGNPMNYGSPMDFGGPVQFQPPTNRAPTQFQPPAARTPTQFQPPAARAPTEFQPLPQPQPLPGRVQEEFIPQGITPFDPPDLINRQDDWLKTQFEMADQHLGGFGGQQKAPAETAATGGTSNIGDDRNNSGEGPGDPDGGYQGVGAPGFGDVSIANINPGLLALSPTLFGIPQAVIDANNQKFTENSLNEAAELDDMNNLAVGTTTNKSIAETIEDRDKALATFLDNNPQNMFDDKDVLDDLMKLDEADLSRVIDDAPGVGLGGASDNSGFGGGGGTSISEGNQGAMGNTGPGNDGTGGQTSSGDDNNSSGDGGGGGDGGGTGCFAEGTLFKMADGSLKPIESIKLKDEMLEGGKVMTVIQGDGDTEDWYNYNGVDVTGGHPVWENDKWVRVEDSINAKSIEGHSIYYVVINENHYMISENGQQFTDYAEIDIKDLESALLAKLNKELPPWHNNRTLLEVA